MDEAVIKKGLRLEKNDFDNLCRSGDIEHPYIDAFGDGYGEPYNPKRIIWGYRDNQLIWTEFNS
jgi:hypothetical protein